MPRGTTPRQVARGRAALVLASLAVSCARSPAPSVVAASPVTRAPVSTPVSALDDGLDVDETIALVEAASAHPSVSITIALRGSPDGRSRLILGSARTDHPEREIRDLTVSGDDGGPLPFERREPSAGGDAGWTVHHAPGATLHIRYRVASTQDVVTSEARSYTRPIERPSFLQLLGTSSLLVPGWISPSAPQRVRFRWQGFREARWTVASSFSVDPIGFRESRSWSDLRNAVYLAGDDLRLVRREVLGRPLYVSIAGRDGGATDDALLELTSRLAGEERTFFHDTEWPFFLVSVVAVAPERAGARDAGGLALTQSLALYLAPGAQVTPRSDGSGVPFLIAHELFHQWNGRRYRARSPGAMTWFVEGFSDFYARRLLLRAGAIDVAAYVANLNEAVARYRLAPLTAAGSPDPEARTDYLHAEGDVVALRVDAEIRRVSHGARSLDDLMTTFLGREAPLFEVDADAVLAQISAFTSPAFAASIRAVVTGGARATVPGDLLAPCLVGHVGTSGRFELGFDDAASRRAHKVVGLVAGSNADRAGLREGDVLVDVDVRPGDPGHPVTLRVRDAAGSVTRAVTYRPEDHDRTDVTTFDSHLATGPRCSRTL